MKAALGPQKMKKVKKSKIVTLAIVVLKKNLFGKREYLQWKNWNIALIEKSAKLMFVLE